jgi:hypothetical protein
MIRRLLNLATLLSLLLSLAAVFMWVRSQSVTEGWDVKPRPAGIIYSGEGWHEGRSLESAGGRLVYVSYKTYIRGTPPPIGGYQRDAKPLTPLRRDRRLGNYPILEIPPTAHGWIPGVAEWYSMPHYAYIPSGQFVAVSWLAIAFVGAVLPGVRVWWRWWRRRQSKGPAFPVLPAR